MSAGSGGHPVTPTVPAGAARRRVSKSWLAAVLAFSVGAAGVLLTACGGDDGDDAAGRAPRLSVDGAYVPRPALTDMAAGYLTVRNDGGRADRLTGVSTSLAAGVSLHTTEKGRMRKVASLDVPAGGQLRLGRGGDHLMLADLGHRPKVGEKITLTLRFATSSPLKVAATVRPTNYVPAE